MKKQFLALFAVALLFLTQVPAEACGDKLLSMARAISLFKAYKPWKTASILIYQVRKDAVVKDKQFQSSLTLAGHKIKTVDKADQLEKTLTAGKFDLVLTDIEDAAALKQQLASRSTAPSVLPLLIKPAKEELVAAEKQYRVVIKTPAGFTDHLQAIDHMMKLLAQKT
jgi:DNA-binding NtrC family response regulator